MSDLKNITILCYLKVKETGHCVEDVKFIKFISKLFLFGTAYLLFIRRSLLYFQNLFLFTFERCLLYCMYEYTTVRMPVITLTTTKTWRLWWCRLVLLIRDPVPFWPLDPGFGMGKKIKIRILDPGWTSRTIFPRAWKQSGIRNLFKPGSVTLMPMMECFSIQNM
jgi:hypothetical protein